MMNPSRSPLAEAPHVRVAVGAWIVLPVLALFPGYFVYHALVAQGLPPVLRGYSVAMAVLVMPVLLLSYFRALPRTPAAFAMDVLAIGFAVLLGASSLFHGGMGADPTVVSNHLGSVPQWISLYLAVRLLPARTATTGRLVVGSWIVMSGLVLAEVSEGQFVGAAVEVALDTRDWLATYQDFAVLYLPVALASFAIAKSALWRTAILSVSLLTLFFNGARSELMALPLGCTMIAWWLSRRRVLLGLGLIFWAATLVALAAAVIEWLPDNRIVDLIETGAASSAGQRQEMLARAITTLAENPWFGAFASYAAGEYAHNGLSAWVDLGAAGFFWLVVMLLLPIVHMTAQLKSRRHEPGFAYTLSLLVLCVMLLAAAKFFTYTLIPIALGAYASDQARRRGREAPLKPLASATLPKPG